MKSLNEPREGRPTLAWGKVEINSQLRNLGVGLVFVSQLPPSSELPYGLDGLRLTP